VLADLGQTEGEDKGLTFVKQQPIPVELPQQPEFAEPDA